MFLLTPLFCFYALYYTNCLKFVFFSYLCTLQSLASMKISCLKCVFLLALLCLCSPVVSQKLITYEAGMGTRDPYDSDVWILYQKVKAKHEGMTLYADSALLNQVRNDLTAFGHVKIVLSDTTTIFGDQLYYDGETRVLDIWDDTVRMVDGKTILKSDHITYDRFSSIAEYSTWGITTNQGRKLVSRRGYYNADFKVFDIYDSVVLTDTNMMLTTDTLVYSMRTHLAEFWSPTHVYTDSTTMYSEQGTYNTDLRYAHSVKSSEVHHGEKHITCDTLDYYEKTEFGQARGHVVLYDTVNDIISTSKYAETNQSTRTSFVTDSALIRIISRHDNDTNERNSSNTNPDTLYIHADTIFLTNDSLRHLESINAFRSVKMFRKDAQGACDSAYYTAIDSTLRMFFNPVLWYDDYQASADTIVLLHDSTGAKHAYFNSNSFFIEKLDAQRYNQIKGRNTEVYFSKGEPTYSDILGNSEMVYYITDEDQYGNITLIGVNVGIGSNMRIYFADRAPDRIVTQGNPDMHTYPLDKIEEEKKFLNHFEWRDAERPYRPMDVFIKPSITIEQPSTKDN